MLFALARLAPEFGFELEAASVDHGLRAEAARDVEIAARQAASLGVAFHALRVHVSPGASVQAQARAARYAALLHLAADRGASRLAVGHTRDDQAETVLLRLVRGTGLHGLGAIDPRRADGVIRPLIDCDRAEVQRLAAAEFSELADDSSNADPRYERVRLRAHVMPLLAAENPNLAEHLAALADEAREYRVPLERAVGELLALALAGPRSLRIAVLAGRPGLLRRAALRAWLERHGIARVSRAHVNELEHAVRSGRGHIWLSQGWSAVATPDGILELQGSLPRGQSGEP